MPVVTDSFDLSDSGNDSLMTFSRQFALLDPLDDKGNFTLDEEFWVSWNHESTRYRLRVPKGVDTDIASVPRIFWTATGITRDGLCRNGAVIHDFLYMYQGEMPFEWFQEYDLAASKWIPCDRDWTRDQSDRMFLKILKACGVSSVKRYAMYQAVHLFGWAAWANKDKNRDKYRSLPLNP